MHSLPPTDADREETWLQAQGCGSFMEAADGMGFAHLCHPCGLPHCIRQIGWGNVFIDECSHPFLRVPKKGIPISGFVSSFFNERS